MPQACKHTGLIGTEIGAFEKLNGPWSWAGELTLALWRSSPIWLLCFAKVAFTPLTSVGPKRALEKSHIKRINFADLSIACKIKALQMWTSTNKTCEERHPVSSQYTVKFLIVISACVQLAEMLTPSATIIQLQEQ